MKHPNTKKITVCLVSVALSMILIFGGCAWYVSDYYHADIAAIDAFTSLVAVTQTELGDGVLSFGNADAEAGLIFYPGGKVEYTAYIPLMQALAEEGMLCVLIRMPGNLAVLDVNAAFGIQERFPDVKHWYIGGHSLGGSMAASYLASHASDFEGLILLAAYSTADLSNTSLSILSIYGSEDGVMNRKKYEKYKTNLSDYEEMVIDGGCHAYFGMYGAQKGDGLPTIDAEEQIKLTAQRIAMHALLSRNEKE